MGLKMQEYKCKDCGHEFEVLLDTRQGEQQVICSGLVSEIHAPRNKNLIGTRIESGPCNSSNVEPILSVGAGSKSHVSWSQWRV